MLSNKEGNIYKELTPELLDEYLKEIASTIDHNSDRDIIAWVGKDGAIDYECTFLRKVLEMTDTPKEEIEIEVTERKEQLEKELESGIYQISSRIDNPIKKLETYRNTIIDFSKNETRN